MFRSACLAIAVALMPATLPAQQPLAPTLYARIGRYDVLARFVDTAFPRVAAHPQLRRLFQGIRGTVKCGNGS